MEFTVFSTDSGPEIGTSERQANTIASCATWISARCVRLVPMYGRILSPNFPAVFAAINSCAIAGQRIAVVSLRKKKKKRRRKKMKKRRRKKRRRKEEEEVNTRVLEVSAGARNFSFSTRASVKWLKITICKKMLKRVCQNDWNCKEGF